MGFGELNKKWHFLGVLALVIPCITLPYYSVIAGWITKYALVFMAGFGTSTADGGGVFSAFISNNTKVIIWRILVIVVAAIILLFGVSDEYYHGSWLWCVVIISAIGNVDFRVHGLCCKYCFLPIFSLLTCVQVA